MSTRDASMGLTEAAASSADVRRNHRLGVLAGTIGNVAHSFLHPELIVAGLIYALTGSKLLVALITILSKAGALAPQLLVGTYVEHLPRRRPSFILLTVGRGLAFSILVVTMWMLTRRPVNAFSLVSFFLAYLLVWIFTGAVHVVYMDMVGRLIPNGRVGSFLGMRHLLGGACAALAGLVIIQPILGNVGISHSYLVLAAIGSGLSILDMWLFCCCREEAGPKAGARTRLTESFRRGLHWLRTDRNYRAYLWLRIAFRINYLGLAFFIPYGKDKLTRAEGATDVILLGGIMVGAMRLSRMGASAIAGRLGDRRGFRACLVIAGTCFLLGPILALTAPALPPLFAVGIPGSGVRLDLPLSVYLVALMLIGCAMQSSVIGGQGFIITSAPPHRRISYMGFLNTLTSPLTLLPLAGAYIADKFGITALFIGLVGGGLLYLAAVLRMRPTPPRGI